MATVTKTHLLKKPARAACGVSDRTSVRVTIFGARVCGVPKELQLEFEAAMRALYAAGPQPGKKWKNKRVWAMRLQSELSNKWGGKSHGGRRVPSASLAEGAVAKKPAGPTGRQAGALRLPRRGHGDTASKESVGPSTPHQVVPCITQRTDGKEGAQQPVAPGVTQQTHGGAGMPVAACVFENLKRRFEGKAPVPLLHDVSLPSADYVCDDSSACALLRCTASSAGLVPFTPRPVVFWLYQVLVYTLAVLQELLGTGRFHADGCYLDAVSKSPASGGEVVAFWGTELGSRRDQGMISYDYDVDLAVFKTADLDFPSVWEQARSILEPLGLRLLSSLKDRKYRICPMEPLAFRRWRELYQQMRQDNPTLSRPRLIALTTAASAHGGQPEAPRGCNCIDIEIITVPPRQGFYVCGSEKILVTPVDCFPTVEGIFGPLRIPLPRTPAILDAEYGIQWRHSRQPKAPVPGTSKFKSRAVDCPGVLRVVWPATALDYAESALGGGFVGAGLYASPNDLVWRQL